jgi:Reverse transcriptase (RNA-dependent DNA polymerase)/GAG-pre-integrase domain
MATNTPSPSHSRFRWILDGGATTHICKDRSAFINFVPCQDSIGGINKQAASLAVLGTGDIKVVVIIDGRKDETVTFRNASYCPDAADNLVSESRMDRKGLAILKKKGKVTITESDGTIVMQGRLLSCNLYELNITLAPYPTSPSHVAFTTRAGQSYDLWHHRLGHIHKGGLRYLAKHNLVTGLNIKIDDTLGPCDGCAKGKHHQAPFPHRVERSLAILDRLHMDLQGPFTKSIAGYLYTLAVIDDHSHMGWKRYLKSKHEASEEIQTLITELENNTGQRVKIIRIDGGREFINGPLKDWLKKKGITLEISAPDTHQQNGVAERFNETTHERALSMLTEAGMSDGFWPEVHQYSNHAHNRSPTKAIPLSTPYEVFYNKKPDVSTLRVFGSRCHVRIPKEKHTKLEPHSLDGIFCGFAHRYKAYKVWIPSRHKFVTSRDVIVYEKLLENNPLVTPAFDEGVSQDRGISSEGFTKAPTEPAVIAPPQTPPKSSNNMEIPFPTPPAPEPTIPQPPPAPRICRTECTTRPTWVKAAADAEKARAAAITASNKVQRELREARRQQIAAAETNTQEPAKASRPLAEQKIVQLAYMAAHGPDTPLSYADAIKSKYADEWREAMEEEINILNKRGTWILEYLPPDRKAVGCRWTFVIKFGPSGTIIRFKARLVAQGFSQIPGIDFDDTFAPTVRQDILRILLHLTISFGWYRGQDDVTAAFLNTRLVETIYMRQPQGFGDGTNRVRKLVRSIYGLKQAARCWNQYLYAALLGIGYHRTYSDSAVYIRQILQDVIILTIHVDNFLSFGNTQLGLKSARKQLHETFEMKEEDPNWLMGFLLVENPATQTISIDHSQYINTILKQFNMQDCDAAKIPLDPIRVLSKDDSPSTDSDKSKMANKPYRKLIGALTWISVTSHPEIAFAATHLAQFNSNPGEAHWEAGKTVLRYLKGAINCHLTLGLHDGNLTELAAYSDSDWGRDVDSRRSITGYIFLLGLSAISWSSKKQTTVATSSVDGVYQAGSMTVRHGLWLHRLLIELGLDKLETSPTTIFIDNRGAIDLTKDNRHHQ